MIEEYLSKLDKVIDPEHCAQAEQRVFAAASCEPVDRLPVTVSCPVDGWKGFTYREGFTDMEKMLVNELQGAWISAHVRDDRVHMIRANYGVGIIASMFGCEVILTDDNAMPWVNHLSDDELDRVLDSGEVNIEAGLGARVFETEHFYLEKLSAYENLSRCVHVFACDTQGPFDSAHLVMGHRIYTEVYDNPERVHRLMDLVTDAYLRFTLAHKEIIGEPADGSYHYHSQLKIPGAARVCDDSGINLSTEFYNEFSRRYNERALAELGGGWVHYCGGGHQILAEVIESSGVTAINFGNPEKQDITRVLRLAQPKGLSVLGWPKNLPLPEGVKTGVTLSWGAASLEEASEIAAG